MARKTRKQSGGGGSGGINRRRRYGSNSSNENAPYLGTPALVVNPPLNDQTHERSLFQGASNYFSRLGTRITSLVQGQPKAKPERPRPQTIKPPSIEEEIEELNKDLAGPGHSLLKVANGERDMILLSRSRAKGILNALTPEQHEIMHFINATGLNIHNLRSCNQMLTEGRIGAIGSYR